METQWQRISDFEDYTAFIYADLNKISKENMTLEYYHWLQSKLGNIFLARKIYIIGILARYDFQPVPNNPELEKQFAKNKIEIESLYNRILQSGSK
jgi:hypothetical protein